MSVASQRLALSDGVGMYTHLLCKQGGYSQHVLFRGSLLKGFLPFMALVGSGRAPALGGFHPDFGISGIGGELVGGGQPGGRRFIW